MLDGDGEPVHRRADRDLAGQRRRPLRPSGGPAGQAARPGFQRLRPRRRPTSEGGFRFITVKPGAVPGPRRRPAGAAHQRRRVRARPAEAAGHAHLFRRTRRPTRTIRCCAGAGRAARDADAPQAAAGDGALSLGHHPAGRRTRPCSSTADLRTPIAPSQGTHRCAGAITRLWRSPCHDLSAASANACSSPLFRPTRWRRSSRDRGPPAGACSISRRRSPGRGRAGVIPGRARPTRSRRSAGPSCSTSAALARGAAAAGNPRDPDGQALTALVAARDADAARYVHWGATSQDVDGYRPRAADRARAGAHRCGSRAAGGRARRAGASAHAHTPLAGRTWLQHAPPVTFGLKAAGWLERRRAPSRRGSAAARARARAAVRRRGRHAGVARRRTGCGVATALAARSRARAARHALARAARPRRRGGVRARPARSARSARSRATCR